jgi:peptidoglycan hydrolase-like protein with peptidoglycan-binding domain
MKYIKFFKHIFILLIILTGSATASINGLYVIDKNGKEIRVEEKQVSFCKLVKKKSNVWNVMGKKSTPLIIANYPILPTLNLSDVNTFKIVGNVNGEIRMNIGTNEINWIRKWNGQIILMDGDRDNNKDENWVAHSFNFEYPFLEEKIENDVVLYKLKQKAKERFLAKEGVNLYAKKNMPMSLFIWEAVRGRKIDKGWIIGINYKEHIERIRGIQHSLTEIGYNPGKVDGLFGTKTRKAIELFQKDNNFTINGYPSQGLFTFLQSKMSNTNSDNAINTNSSADTSNAELIKNIKSKLTILEVYQGSIDGFIDDNLTMAITEFQKRTGIEKDGIPSHELLVAIEKHIKKYSLELKVKEALNLFDKKLYLKSYETFNETFNETNFKEKFSEKQIRYYISHQYVNIGMIAGDYYDRKQYKNAINWYKKSIEIGVPTYEFSYDMHYVSNIYFLSLTYYVIGEDKNGKMYFQKATELSKDNRISVEDKKALKQLYEQLLSSDEIRNKY